MKPDALLLAADVGGTKTSLALFSASSGARKWLASETYPSLEFRSLKDVIGRFLAGREASIHHASVGVAGPVVENRVRVTNLSWAVDGDDLARDLGFPVFLLNDLAAIARAIPLLAAGDLLTINAGKPVEHGPLAVVAPGTGLGEAFLLWDGQRYRPYASEGGHVDFAPANDLEIGLLSYLWGHVGHVSYERVCSGSGIPNLYRFLKDTHRFDEPPGLALELAQLSDPTPTILRGALEERVPICMAALDLFLSILGAEAGNLALKVLATGGVYLAGGIPPRLRQLLQGKGFMSAFTRKGRLGDLLARVPVHVVVHPQVALLGAADYALDRSGQRA